MARAGVSWLAAVFWAFGIYVSASGPATAETLDAIRSQAERMERWHAARNGSLKLPLPGTPDTEKLMTRLVGAGIELGAPMMIRIFKEESQLEVWIKKGRTFQLFAIYPVCYWSGALGPKMREGDRRTPEGFYTVTEAQLHHGERWRRSLDVGFPNVFDRVNGRSGSAILVHGGCDSSGCFAMTNAVNGEIYALVEAALRGVEHVPVQIFPFRMSDANMAANASSEWTEFWGDLKEGYDSFERTRLPPQVSVCAKRYRARDASPFEREAAGVELCEQDRAWVPDHLQQAKPEPPEPIEQIKKEAKQQAKVQRPSHQCRLARASCRKWVALNDRRVKSRTVAGRVSLTKRSAVR